MLAEVEGMKFIDMSDYNRVARSYWWATTLVGMVVVGFASVRTIELDGSALLKLAMMIGLVYLAGMYPIRVPATQVLITPSDIFIFLTAVLLGAEAATVIAVIDTALVSYRHSKRWTSRLGGPAMMAIAIFTSATVFEWVIGWLKQSNTFNRTTFLAALLSFSFLYFLLNSSLLILLQALKKKISPILLWRENYPWMSLAYAASASVAGLIYLGDKEYGIAPLIAACPIVALIVVTSHFYFRQADERARADRQRIEAAETQARQAQSHAQELAESEERFRSAFDFAAIGMALVGTNGGWLQVNRALCSILGYSEEELLATTFQSLTHPEDVDEASRHLAQLLTTRAPSVAIEKRYTHKLGHTVWTLLNASIIRDAKNHSLRFIFQIQDITDKKRAEEKLAHDAFHDAITDLPNRALFLDRLSLAMARIERNPSQIFAVLFLDVDRFKVINDSLGHLFGDQLLVAIARRLKGILRPGDTVARLGGDEFTILIEDINASIEAVALAERIQKELKAPFNIGDREIFISSSIGIAPGDAAYQKPEEILRDADTAMHQAKSAGRARYALFDKGMHARAVSLLQLETDMRRGVERGEFFAVYQPIVSLQTGMLTGFEALVRWRHPERGLISPADFIPLAEETGHINSIGQIVFDAVCSEMRQWQAESQKRIPISVSINLSGKQFTQDGLTDQIMRALERAGIEPRQIKLEITESVVMENIEAAIEMLEQLHARGIQLSIDDFGTGYSSLSYLHRLPIDTLKIDRSFIDRMEGSSENAEIVRTIIALGRNLRMSITAEGIETVDQLNQLRALDCDSGQGYLFSKPLEAEDARQIVRQIDEWRAFDQGAEITYPAALLPLSKYTM